LEQRQKRRSAIIGERRQDIDVAVGPEVVAYHRAEKIEFDNPPAPADGLDGLLVDEDANCMEIDPMQLSHWTLSVGI